MYICIYYYITILLDYYITILLIAGGEGEPLQTSSFSRSESPGASSKVSSGRVAIGSKGNASG